MDDERLTVRVRHNSANALAAATALTGALNISVSSFLLDDPLGVGVEDLADELTSIRHGGGEALRAFEAAIETDGVVDLEPVARVSVRTAGAGVFLALRCLEVIRRAGVGPAVEAEVARLEEEVEALMMGLPKMDEVVAAAGYPPRY